MNSLDKRKDSRSLDVFEHNIKDFTEREYYWGLALRIDFCERGINCQIEEHGVDNQGNLILGRLPNYNVDKIFNFTNGKKMHIEIKTIEEYVKNFFTFKVSSLNSCVQQNAHIIVPRSSHYYLIKNETIKEILKNYKHAIYEKFHKKEKAVRIFTDNIENMIVYKKIIKNKWKEKAKDFILKNYNIVFRQKMI